MKTTNNRPTLLGVIGAAAILVATVVRGDGLETGLAHPPEAAKPGVLVAMNRAGTVERYDGASGQHLGTFIAGIPSPNGLAFGPDGHLYVTTGFVKGPGTVRRYDGRTGRSLGDFVPERAPGHPGCLQRGAGLAWHEGDLFAVSCDDSKLHRYDGRTGAFKSTVAVGNPQGWMTQLALRDGTGFVADYHACGIRRFDLRTGADRGLAVKVDRFSPWGVAFDEQGRLYWSGNAHTIRRFDSQNDIVWVGPREEIRIPIALAFDPNGWLYCAGFGSDTVTVWNSSDGKPLRTIRGPEVQAPIAFAFTTQPMPERRTAVLGATNVPAEPVVRIVANLDMSLITHLSWDTESGPRARQNLLRGPLELRARSGHRAANLAGAGELLGPDAVRFRLSSTNTQVDWTIRAQGGGLTMEFRGAAKGQAEMLELILPFNPVTTPTTVLPAHWEKQGSLRLPAIISAPDFGQMLVTASPQPGLAGRLVGSRAHRTVDFILELPAPGSGETVTLSFQPVRLPAPQGLQDTALWRAARRGWFGALQCSAEWGDPGHAFSAPAGMLANNVISDPASCSLWFYADQAFFTPELAPGVSAMNLVRRTLDWWLDTKILPSGEMICYWDKTHFLDANAGPLIAAWDYVEATGDQDWLARRIERLELLAAYLARRDVDGDGLVEAVQSGNAGTLQEPARSCAWWDALNCGHQDSYSNALIYRAWRCLADLEARLKRREQQHRYTQLAGRLKAAYFQTLFNKSTGWLAWWKSEDGALHDYASPVVNGLVIEYGLVPAEQGRQILTRLRNKMAEVDFRRFDLGVPPMLVPVRREDYLLPNAAGIASREDGTDTFGYYMNGGITAGQVLHFLAAHYGVGQDAEADRILRAMLGRQTQGGFQNGAVNAYPQGIDWTTWDGKPSGYEGYLADSFRFLQAVLLREPGFRQRLYRPLTPAP